MRLTLTNAVEVLFRKLNCHYSALWCFLWNFGHWNMHVKALMYCCTVYLNKQHKIQPLTCIKLSYAVEKMQESLTQLIKLQLLVFSFSSMKEDVSALSYVGGGAKFMYKIRHLHLMSIYLWTVDALATSNHYGNILRLLQLYVLIIWEMTWPFAHLHTLQKIWRRIKTKYTC